MKIFLTIVGGLVGLAALVVIVGSLSPHGHVASRTVIFNKSSAEIWETITDFTAAASWRVDVKSMQRLADQNGHPVWRVENRQGPITYEVTVLEPRKRMVMRIADDSLPFGGTWTYEITGTDAPTTLTITENGEVYNPLFRFMARFVFGHQATLETYLRDLGTKFGEDVNFDHDAI